MKENKKICIKNLIWELNGLLGKDPFLSGFVQEAIIEKIQSKNLSFLESTIKFCETIKELGFGDHTFIIGKDEEIGDEDIVTTIDKALEYFEAQKRYEDRVLEKMDLICN